MANTKLINTGIEVGSYTDEKTAVLNSCIEISNAEINNTIFKNAGIEASGLFCYYFSEGEGTKTAYTANGLALQKNSDYKVEMNPNDNASLATITGQNAGDKLTWDELKTLIDTNAKVTGSYSVLTGLMSEVITTI